MKKVILPIALVALVFGSGCKSKADEDATQIPDIDVAQVKVDSVTTYNVYPGTLTANRSVDLVARVSGYLNGQYYQNGDFVKKGQLLFTIEDTQYRDAVQQAQAQLATARSNYDYAAAQYSAMKKALESDAVAKMEVTKAQSAMEQAQASIKTAQAALQTAQTQLGYCRVYAPFDGHVTMSTLSTGNFVDGAASPVTLATIYEDNVMYAVFYVDDKTLQEIENEAGGNILDADSIPIHFDQDVRGTYFGKMNFVAPDVDPTTGTLKLRAEIQNTYGELHDGMFVSISLPSSFSPDAMLVKDSAISTDQLGKYLYTVDSVGTVAYTPIEVGQIINDSLRVVTKGVKPGEMYVTKAMLKVRDGMKVNPVKK